ncbi:MAG: lysophospholipid acyltransferase family protein, partial [Planctomycetota bacterium]|nr:lysophospholipid acyltransferase family protein [Planctomycetota bacterium]
MSATNQPTVCSVLLGAVRWCNVVLTVAVYLALLPFGWTLFAILCFLGRRDPVALARRLQRIQVFAYRLMHDWLRFALITRFRHRESLPGLPAGPCVVVANHPTLMDITAITAVLGGGCTIVKPAMFRRRFLHRLLVGAGHIEGPGADVLSIGRAIDEAVDRLRNGFSVIVFPEGTRAPPGELLPFGRSPFEIACRAGVPLVSLAIVCRPPYLSKDVPLFRPPHPTAELSLSVLAVDNPADFGNDSRKLQSCAETRYRSWQAACAKVEPPCPSEEKETRCQISSKTG